MATQTRGKRKTSTSASSLPAVKEGQRFEQVVDGQKIIMEIKKGKAEVVSVVSLLEARTVRHFRLKPIPPRLKGLINKEIRYAFNQGPGRKVLRFYQGNFEGAEHDPKKERVVAVTDADTARSLSSMTSKFEEVFPDDDEG